MTTVPMSTQFMKDYNKRRMFSPGPSLREQCNASPAVRELFATASKSGVVAFIEHNGNLKMAVCPIYKRDEDGSLDVVLLSGSSTELAPCMATPEFAQHYPLAGSHRQIAPWTASARTALSADMLAGSGMTAANMYFAAIPKIIALPQGKDIVEGCITDTAVIEKFTAEYGEEAGEWLVAANLAFENLAATEAIYKNLVDAAALDAAIGASMANMTLEPGGPSVYLSMINKSSHPAYYEELFEACGPYAAFPAASAASTSSGGVSVKDLASIVETAKSRQEKTRLKNGYNKCRGMYAGGDFDIETGKLTSIVLPQPTEAHKQANLLTTLEERTDAVKRMFDTCNRLRPKGAVIAIAASRDMNNHDPQMCRQILGGQFSKSTMTSMKDKPVRCSILSFCPLSVSDNTMVVGEMEEQEARRARNEETEGVRIYLIIPDEITGLGQLKSTIANFVSISDALWIMTEDEEGRPVVTRVFVYVFDYLHDTDFAKYYVSLTTDDRLDIVYHLFARMDKFIVSWYEASDDFSTNTAIASDEAAKIVLTEFKKAARCIAKDITSIKDAVEGGKKIESVVSWRPSRSTPPPPTKKHKTATQERPLVPATANTGGRGGQGGRGGRGDWQQNSAGRGGQGTGRQGQGASTWGSSWNRGTGGTRPQARRTNPSTPQESMTKGDFIPRPGSGFAATLAPGLANVYCSNFATKTKYCGNDNCTLKHLPFFKWKEEDKTIQIQHVEDNKESMCISKGFRGLPDNKKHLLGDENGPTGERS